MCTGVVHNKLEESAPSSSTSSPSICLLVVGPFYEVDSLYYTIINVLPLLILPSQNKLFLFFWYCIPIKVIFDRHNPIKKSSWIYFSIRFSNFKTYLFVTSLSCSKILPLCWFPIIKLSRSSRDGLGKCLN